MTKGSLTWLQARVRNRPYRGLITRLAVCAGLWWVLTDGELGSWLWGLPAVLGAVLFNPFHDPTLRSWRPVGVLRFIPVFLWFSLRSALDVAWRAMHPERPLAPTLVDYPWRLPAGRARIFLANLINLMPGTLCVRIGDRALTVHILANPDATLAGLQRLEHHVAGLFVATGEQP